MASLFGYFCDLKLVLYQKTITQMYLNFTSEVLESSFSQENNFYKINRLQIC